MCERRSALGGDERVAFRNQACFGFSSAVIHPGRVKALVADLFVVRWPYDVYYNIASNYLRWSHLLGHGASTSALRPANHA